jgi:hypothetical protein
MTSPGSSPDARVVAVIDPGARPHLVAAVGMNAPDRRPISPSLPRLDSALSACLATLRDEPARFERAAMVWHARWCTLLPELTLAEAKLALGGLEALQGPQAVEGAQALRRLCDLHGLADVAGVLDRWILLAALRTCHGPGSASAGATPTSADPMRA